MTEKNTPERYLALGLQVMCDGVNADKDVETARARMHASIERLHEMVVGNSRFTQVFSGAMPKLVVLPEYFLSGYPMGDTIPGWAEKAGIDMDGPEYEALGKIAQDAKCYLSGNVYERDPNFPDMYFQTSFILDPSGDVALRYRRLISMFAPTPYDVMDKYLDLYGKESLFPVLDCELGRVACIASEEILYPELARALAARGAEVFCHSSSELASPAMTKKNIAKRARAQENIAYVVSANSAGIANNSVPFAATDGRSQIVDYHGHVLEEASQGETNTATAEIDISGLRHERRIPAMNNLLARQRFGLFAETYSEIEFYPPTQCLILMAKS